MLFARAQQLKCCAIDDLIAEITCLGASGCILDKTHSAIRFASRTSTRHLPVSDDYETSRAACGIGSVGR